MRTISQKATNSNPVKPTKLGVKMKASAKGTHNPAEISKLSTEVVTTPKPFTRTERAWKTESRSANTTLPSKWISTCAPSNFKFAKDLKLSTSVSEGRPKHSTPVIKKKFVQGRSLLGRKEEYPSLGISKLVDKPRLNTNNHVQLGQKLKQKEVEINRLKQKLWLGDSHKTRPRSNPYVLDVLGKFDMKENIVGQIVETSDKVQIESEDKLQLQLNDLRGDIAQKDEEILMLKHHQWKMQEMLNTREMELVIVQNKLKAKDLEMLEGLNNKNQEIVLLKREKIVLEEDVKNQTIDIDFLNAVVEKRFEEAPARTETDDDSNDLEKEAADFLERVSAVCKDKNLKVKATSKDKNVKIQVKVSVRKDNTNKVSHNLSFSDTFDNSCMFVKTPSQESSSKREYDEENQVKGLDRHMGDGDEVNEECNDFLKSVKKVLR